MFDSSKLDIFDLKKIKINRTAKELEEAGKEKRAKVSSEQLAKFIPVHRDPVAAIKKQNLKWSKNSYLCVMNECWQANSPFFAEQQN